MNHGDGNVTRLTQTTNLKGTDDFARALCRVAVAQLCQTLGFHATKESALDALSEIAIRYLCDFGKTANFNANLTGRTHCNFFDIVRALEAMEFSQGFPGAADTARCLVGSGAVKELSRYLSLADEIPFAHPVARFPVAKTRRPIPSFAQIEEAPPGTHVPAWLPALPDPHTYLRSAAWSERKTDPREDKIELIRQRRKAERSLFCLQQRLLVSEGEGGNPFLDAPLRAGEKEVSAVERPARLCSDDADDKGGSVLEAFGPAIEAVKNGFCEDESRPPLVLLPDATRPAVNFKFRTVKKFLVESSSDLGLGKKDGGSEKGGYWFTRDEERDDKKRRAEFILRQSIENPQELNQM